MLAEEPIISGVFRCILQVGQIRFSSGPSRDVADDRNLLICQLQEAILLAAISNATSLEAICRFFVRVLRTLVLRGQSTRCLC